LAIAEVDLFRAVVKSGEAELIRQLKDNVETQKNNSGSNSKTALPSRVSGTSHTVNSSQSLTLASVLSSILPLIRFPLMSIAEFATAITPTALLTPKQSLEVYSYLSLPEDKRTTATISFLSKPRHGSVLRWEMKVFGTGGLCDKNMSVTNEGVPSNHYPVAIGTREWKTGVLCWQATLKEIGHWVCLGACQAKTAYVGISNPSFGYEDPSWWGWSSANQRFTNGHYVEGGGVTWIVGQHIHFRLDLKRLVLQCQCIESGVRAEYTSLPAGISWVPSVITMGGVRTVINMRPLREHEFGVSALS